MTTISEHAIAEFAEAFGKTREEVLNMTWEEVRDLIGEEDRAETTANTVVMEPAETAYATPQSSGNLYWAATLSEALFTFTRQTFPCNTDDLLATLATGKVAFDADPDGLADEDELGALGADEAGIVKADAEWFGGQLVIALHHIVKTLDHCGIDVVMDGGKPGFYCRGDRGLAFMATLVKAQVESGKIDLKVACTV